MAALELLALVMLADSHLGDDELDVLRELTEDWRGKAFSFEQYLGPAVAKAAPGVPRRDGARVPRRRRQHVELVVAEVRVGEHDAGQRSSGRHVLTDRRWHAPATPRVQLLAAILHRAATLAAPGRAERPADAGDGDAVAAGEVGADLDRLVAAGGEQLGDRGALVGADLEDEPAARLGSTAARRRRSRGWRRARPARRTAPPAAPTRAPTASTSGESSAMYGGLATARSSVVPAGRASNHDPTAMRTLRPRRPSPARLARATSMASALGVGQPHGDAVERQLVGERQPDRSRPGAEVGDGQRARQRAAPARWRRRRRPRSPAAGSAPGGRRRGRGGGSSSGRARRPAARRRGSARPSSSRWATIRGDAWSPSTPSSSSARRSPPRTASGRRGRRRGRGSRR